MGASADLLQQIFDRAAAYQLPSRPVDEAIVQKLGDKAQFSALLGIQDQYPNFLVYFQRQIEKRGMEVVVNEYLFAADKLADDMLVRLFAGMAPGEFRSHPPVSLSDPSVPGHTNEHAPLTGLIHPFIQLGFGVEFNQPAIVAEALAETAVHESNLTFLLPAEEAAGGVGKEGKKSLVHLQQEIRSNTQIRKAVRWEDVNKIDGMLARALDEIIKITSQFSVGPDQLELKLAELLNAVGTLTP